MEVPLKVSNPAVRHLKASSADSDPASRSSQANRTPIECMSPRSAASEVVPSNCCVHVISRIMHKLQLEIIGKSRTTNITLSINSEVLLMENYSGTLQIQYVVLIIYFEFSFSS